MTCSMLPDVNVWFALSLDKHEHHRVAWQWYRSLRLEQPAFCRVTQLSLLRLLTDKAAAGEQVLTQIQAWSVYDRWLGKGGARFLEEPLGLDLEFRFHTNRSEPAHKTWNDSYLIAFAAASSLPLITFDKGLSRRYAGTICLC